MSRKLLKQSLEVIEGKKSLSVDNEVGQNKDLVWRNKVYKRASRFQKTDNYYKSHLRGCRNIGGGIKNQQKHNSGKYLNKLEQLKQLTVNMVRQGEEKLILKRATKCQSTEEETTSLDNSSIFTDEDFRKFEEEYRLFAIKKNAKIGDQLIS